MAVEPLATPSNDDPTAQALRGFGPLGIVVAAVILLVGNDYLVPLSALLVLAWVRASGTPWSAIGYVRPRSWVQSAALGIVGGIAFKLLMKIVVMPLFGADPINHTYHYFAHNSFAIPGAVYTMIVAAGFGEETTFRGFLFERLGKLFGSSPAAKTSIVVLSSVTFALAHYTTQGLTGVEQATITGLVFGTLFARTGSIFPLMCAHAAYDLTAFLIIYFDREADLAHLIFS